jgi:hypothetical protein
MPLRKSTGSTQASRRMWGVCCSVNATPKKRGRGLTGPGVAIHELESTAYRQPVFRIRLRIRLDRRASPLAARQTWATASTPSQSPPELPRKRPKFGRKLHPVPEALSGRPAAPPERGSPHNAQHARPTDPQVPPGSACPVVKSAATRRAARSHAEIPLPCLPLFEQPSPSPQPPNPLWVALMANTGRAWGVVRIGRGWVGGVDAWLRADAMGGLGFGETWWWWRLGGGGAVV